MNYIILIFVGMLSLFYYNTFIWLIQSWLNNPYYSHGFLVPIISGYFIWRIKDELSKIERKQSNMGLILFVIGIIVQIISVIFVIRFLSGISLIIIILGTILYLFGYEYTEKIKFPILFLLLAIPVPFVDLVAPPAQTISAVASAEFANLIGIPVQRDGLILNTPLGGSFEVALECSGIRSVISLLALSIIYAYILDNRITNKLIIVFSSIPLAMTGNIIRIVSVLGVAQEYGRDAATNYFHDFSSITVFSIALIGLFIVGRLFGKPKFKKI